MPRRPAWPPPRTVSRRSIHGRARLLGRRGRRPPGEPRGPGGGRSRHPDLRRDRPGPAGAPRLASAVRAEWDAAGAALGDALHASPPIAALLARIAAQRAAHADLLARAAGTKAPASARRRQPPRSCAAAADPAAPRALPPTGTLGARPRSSRRPRRPDLGRARGRLRLRRRRGTRVPGRREAARAAWAWHLARRDLLEERLLAAGVQPPVAAPAYDVGAAPDASGAARLAATVERRLAGLAVRAVAATEGDDRREAAAGLVEGARRLAGWTGRPETLPG